MRTRKLTLLALLASTTPFFAGHAGANDLESLRYLSNHDAIEAFKDLRLPLSDNHHAFCGNRLDATEYAHAAVLSRSELSGGNALAASDANSLRPDLGADGIRERNRAGNNFSVRTRTEEAVVFLDFDPDAGQLPTFEVDFIDEAGNLLTTFVLDDYVFTSDDRNFIRDRIAADLAPYGYTVTTTQPTSGPFTEIDFANNDRVPGEDTNITLIQNANGGVGFSVLFGRADEIDFLDDNLQGTAFTDASVWVVVAELFTAGTFEFFTGIPADGDGDGNTDAEAVQTAVRNQASNTGAHEAGHTFGLRHHDSIGRIGEGLPSTGRPAPTTFVPAFIGPQDAAETTSNIMASGASVGIGFADSANADRSFSQRSALKLRLAQERIVFQTEEQVDLSPPNPFGLPPRFLNGRRALPDGQTRRDDNDNTLFTHLIQGSISTPGEVDPYSFFAREGDIINAEVISFSDSLVADFVSAEIDIFQVDFITGSFIPLTFNAQTFEPIDPLLFEFVAPANGFYTVVVSSPDRVFLDLDGDGLIPDVWSDFSFGPLFLEGDYDLLIYRGRAPRRNEFVTLAGL